MKKFPVLIFTIILIVSFLPMAKVEFPYVLGSDTQNSSFLDLTVETFENVKDLPPTQYRYNAKDNQGIGLDTIKIIQISERVYLGVYHSFIRGTFQVRLANSTDLLNWTYVRTIELRASQPAIALAPNGAYIIAFEKEENESWSHLTFHYYSNLSTLLSETASPDAVYDVERSSFNQNINVHEGTPNIYNITLKGPMMHLSVGFHYDNGVVDNVAIGSLWIPLDNLEDINRWVWNETRPLDCYNQKLRDEYLLEGHVGDRDYGQIFGRNFSLQEAQKVKGNDGTWSIFLYDHSNKTFHKLNTTTHKGSVSIANPTFTWLKSPNGKNCLVVTYFLHTYNESAKQGEEGELIFYKEFETEKYNVRYEGNNYSVYVTSNSSLPMDLDLYCAVYPYSYNNMTSLHQTDFEIQLDKVKEIGFTGIKLWNVECFYDEDLLQWVMNETKERGLNVIVPIQYFNRSYSFPFPKQAWERKGFIENSAELNLFNEYVSNVSLIVRGYINFKGWIIYYPFNSSDFWYWHERVAWIEYKWNLQSIIDAVRKASGHPLYLSVELWKEYPQDVWDRLPKDLNFIQGFAFQPYNTIKDSIQADKIREFYDYWKRFGCVQIAEFGYATHNDVYVHGLASSENRKANMITEFLNYVKNLGHDGFVCYFGLTDFPPENADFGIVYDNCTLKESGEAFKDWIEEDQKKFDFNETERGININVTGPDGSKGFLIAELPNILTQDLWKGNYTVLLDNKPLPFENWTSTINTYIYVTYTHSEHKLTIIPEYPSFLIILLTFTVGPLLCCLHSKRAQQNSKRQAHPVCPPN